VKFLKLALLPSATKFNIDTALLTRDIARVEKEDPIEAKFKVLKTLLILT
jgi:hypothetical protein